MVFDYTQNQSKLCVYTMAWQDARLQPLLLDISFCLSLTHKTKYVHLIMNFPTFHINYRRYSYKCHLIDISIENLILK